MDVGFTEEEGIDLALSALNPYLEGEAVNPFLDWLEERHQWKSRLLNGGDYA